MKARTQRSLLLLAPWVLLSACAQHHLAVADKAYVRYAFATAAKHYEKALLRADDRAAALNLARAYHRLNQLDRAADWYGYAHRVTPLDNSDALEHGRILQSLGREQEAAALFERVLKERPEDAVVRNLGLALASSALFHADTTLFAVERVQIPGVSSAFGAIPYEGGLLFAAEAPPTGRHTNPWNGGSFLDLYTSSNKAQEVWSAASRLPGPVNGRFHDGPAVLSADGRTLYFTRSDYYKFRLLKDENSISHLMLYRAEKQADGSWGDVRSFAYNGEDFSAGHAALNAAGDMLYYISDMPGGFGGTDIYRCERQADGNWGFPHNLGPTVNTSANEMFPTLYGDTLYFSSNGHHTMGGLDLFRTYPDSLGWTAPENLNYPVNSVRDDFALQMLPGGQEGYLSSDRSGTDGIYHFTVHEPVLFAQGRFADETNDAPMAGVEVRLLDLTSGEEMKELTGPEGTFTLPLHRERSYRLVGARDGMFSESRDIDTHGQRIGRTWTEEFKLKRVVIDRPIMVENIYYDVDRWEIRPEAAEELNKLARIFKDNPHLTFELSSHTDSRASATYNLVLSEARANSAVDHLIRNGVEPARIMAKGYGESQLVNRCADGVECSEEEHQANRRTEFKVIGSTASLP